jgi:predicted RNA-binding Zn ribbon-like protein
LVNVILPISNGANVGNWARADRWPLRGGVACLDFANTLAYRPTGQTLDALPDYDDLIAWSRHAGLLSLAEVARLHERAAADPPGAAETLTRAVVLREATYRLFVALARGDEIDGADLAAIEAVLVEGVAHATLVRDGDGFAFRNRANEDDLAVSLWKLAESAAQLLVSGEWRRVRECPGHDCGWLFLDQTKNGNRRWCDSADCGNRARVRAHYQRRRTGVGGRKSEVGSRK